MKKMIQFANMFADCTQHLSDKWRQTLLEEFKKCKERATESASQKDDTCPMIIFAHAMYDFSQSQIISHVLGVKGYEVENLARETASGLSVCAFLLKSEADKGPEGKADEGKAVEGDESEADKVPESKAVAADEGKADEGDEGDSTSSSTSSSDEGI